MIIPPQQVLKHDGMQHYTLLAIIYMKSTFKAAFFRPSAD